METVKNLGNQVSETVQGAGATAQKETDKNVAKDNNADLGTRADAAKGAVSNKMDEQKHDASPTPPPESLQRADLGTDQGRSSQGASQTLSHIVGLVAFQQVTTFCIDGNKTGSRERSGIMIQVDDLSASP
ncbi:MAG: hypothetical protein Q9183_001561 [Haloplaca sp. 2 TL-2023]